MGTRTAVLAAQRHRQATPSSLPRSIESTAYQWSEDRETRTSETVAAITLLLLAGTATPAVPIVLARTYTVTVDSVDQDAKPLAVAIPWAFGAISAAATTPFDISGVGGELVLTAPLKHVQTFTLYIFEYWTVNETIYSAPIVRFNVGGVSRATTHYAKTLSVNKELRECYTTDGTMRIPCDPNIVPNGTQVYFTMRITLHAYKSISNIVVKDGISADLVLDSWAQSTGELSSGKPRESKTGATIVTWTISTTGKSGEHTLDLQVHTGINPQGKQEYTSPGKHYLDDGPEIHLNYNTAEYVFQGSPVEVTVVLYDGPAGNRPIPPLFS